MSDYRTLQRIRDVKEQNQQTHNKLDNLLKAFNAQTDAINRQATASEALVTLMTKIEENTNPNPKINFPSKRVDMNK